MRGKTATGIVWSLALGLAGICPSFASAAAVDFGGSQGDLEATANFDVDGDILVITLTNTSTADVMIPSDVLSGVFFDIEGAMPSLTAVSAVVGPTSNVLFSALGAGTDVGGEFGFVEGLVGYPTGANYGISASGLGLFGPGDLFGGPNLQGPVSPNGMQYGIVSAGDDPMTGNAAVTGANELIQNQVIFRLSGVPLDFDPEQSIRNVVFQYGTSLSQPRTPEPASIGLLAVSGLLLSRKRRSAV